MEKKTVKVYDVITKKMVDVEVSDEVYTAFNRSGWDIKNNNKTFYKHEIQFSQLLDDLDFKSLLDNGTEERAIKSVLIEKLLISIEKLYPMEQELIHMLFYEGKSERECAEHFGINQKNIHRNKMHILCKLYKLLGKIKN